MQKQFNPKLNKYFWDHTLLASDGFKLKRLLEYASFPDLLKIPFDFVKENIESLDPTTLRTSTTRIRFTAKIKEFINDCHNWDELIFKITGIN